MEIGDKAIYQQMRPEEGHWRLPRPIDSLCVLFVECVKLDARETQCF